MKTIALIAAAVILASCASESTREAKAFDAKLEQDCRAWELASQDTASSAQDRTFAKRMAGQCLWYLNNSRKQRDAAALRAAVMAANGHMAVGYVEPWKAPVVPDFSMPGK